MITSNDFYYPKNNQDIALVLRTIYQSNENKTMIYLIGDSLLDNGNEIKKIDQPVIQSYENVISDKIMKNDICYQINSLLQENNKNFVCINCATANASVSDKKIKLDNIKDMFVSRRMKDGDVLVVSLSGNDLSSTKMDFASKIQLFNVIQSSSIEKIKQNPSMLQFLFSICKDQLTSYIKRIIHVTKPSKVLLFGLMYPCTDATQQSTVSSSLEYIQYSQNPGKLQCILDMINQYAISKIQIPGIDITYIETSSIIDCNNKNEYVDRTIPSEIGGIKISNTIYESIFS